LIAELERRLRLNEKCSVTRASTLPGSPKKSSEKKAPVAEAEVVEAVEETTETVEAANE